MDGTLMTANRDYSHIPIREAHIRSARGGALLVNGELWDSSRIGAAIMNYSRMCKCGRCLSCQVGQYALKGRNKS